MVARIPLPAKAPIARPTFVIAGLRSPRCALREKYIQRPHRLGRRWRCTDIHILGYLIRWQSTLQLIIQGFLFDLYYMLQHMRDSPMTAASTG